MRWKFISKQEKVQKYINEMETWKPYFILKPMVVNGETIWLERIYRKGKHDGYVPSNHRAREFYRGRHTATWARYDSDHSVPIFKWEYRTDMLDILKKSGSTNDGPDGG